MGRCSNPNKTSLRLFQEFGSISAVSRAKATSRPSHVTSHHQQCSRDINLFLRELHHLQFTIFHTSNNGVSSLPQATDRAALQDLDFESPSPPRIRPNWPQRKRIPSLDRQHHHHRYRGKGIRVRLRYPGSEHQP